MFGREAKPTFFPSSAVVRRICFLLGVMSLCHAPTVFADDAASLEKRVKSGCVVNFVQFIDWPEAAFAKPDDPIVIGIMDSDPMEPTLATAVEGKTIKGRKIVIRRLKADAGVQGCHVLIIDAANAAHAADLIKSAGSGVLTIGDSDNFTDSGGIIRFYIEDRKVRFEINLTGAQRSRLQVSSKLLKLAKVVNK
jgi:hypothetical protein